MRIEPRQEVLATWKAIAKWLSSGGATWRWDGEVGRNSISDAELLMCLLHPPTKISGLRYDRPDKTAGDVLAALAPLGNAVEIPRQVVRLIGDFLDKYTEPDTGLSVFGGGDYFVAFDPDDERRPTTEQKSLDVVDSFATSVALTTAIIGFLRGYSGQQLRKSLRDDVEAVEAATRRRLTAAMVGLQRSFALNVFRAASPPGRALCRMISGYSEPAPAVVAAIRRELRDVIAGLGQIGIDPERVIDLTEDPETLFECGWSWGVVRDATEVRRSQQGGTTQRGFAEAAPYLYFTVVAVDGIKDLFTRQANIRGLLDDEQQQLARTLGLQWELARRYWSTIATLSVRSDPRGRRWPLEDIPWRTTDDDETDYYTLLVTSLVLQELEDGNESDAEFARVAKVMEDLADRVRIRRRAMDSDRALTLHHPGARIALVGSEEAGTGGPRLGWVLTEAATLVLGRTLVIAKNADDSQLRARLLRLADDTWRHISDRRHNDGSVAGLWDQPVNVFPALEYQAKAPSWYYTTRSLQCLATAAEVIESKPPFSAQLAAVAADLLVEADHALDEERLRGPDDAGPALRDSLRRQATSLRRAERILSDRPGTAFALLSEVLRELDKLSAAREPEAGE